ncbi:MAG: AMIN domain-containing protein, partial [Rhodospirillales bacterium]|nr:AMIN domain-containing protein [Rhodospirillales bacterium]
MYSGRLAGVGFRSTLIFAAVLAALTMPGRLQAQQFASTSASHKAKPADKAPAAKIETTRTRFIINLERHVDFEVSALTQPNRVLVDLPDVKVVLPDPLGDTPVGLIKSFRHGVSAPGKSRVVIDVTGPVVVERTDIEKGPDGKSAKLTVDIVSAPKPRQPS